MKRDSGKINILVIIIIVLTNVIILGTGYYFFIIKPSRSEDQLQQQRLNTLERVDVQAPQRQRIEPTPNRLNAGNNQQGFVDTQVFDVGGKDYLKNYALYNIESLTINLAGKDPTYLVVAVTLEYRQSDKKLPDELKMKTPIFKDKLIGYFSRLSIDVVRDNNYREIFRDDILSIINGQLLEGRVTNVLFEQFVFQ